MEKTFAEKLSKIQEELNVPKSKFNAFGKYNYRSVEDIQSAIKKPLADNGLLCIVGDELILIGDRYYVKATATISDENNTISNTAYAREPETVKGQGEAQITGSSSSYARKYALGGLFLIDDLADDDTTNKHGKEEPKLKNEPVTQNPKLLNQVVDLLATQEERTEGMLKYFKVKNLSEMTNEKLREAISMLSNGKK